VLVLVVVLVLEASVHRSRFTVHRSAMPRFLTPELPELLNS